VIISALIIASVGVLTSLEPARQTSAREEGGVTLSETVEGTTIDVTLAPGTTGSNRVFIDLSDRSGDPITNASAVNVQVSFVEREIGEVSAVATPAGDGRYVVDDVLLSLAGIWQIEVHVVRPDAFDARTAFRAEIGGAGAGPAPLDRDVGRLLFGAQFAAIAVFLLAMGVSLGGWWKARGIATMGTGMLSGVVAIAYIATNPLLAGAGGSTTNPFTPDADSLAKGRAVYTENCASCHGTAGRGDGPAAPGLHPPPSNLAEHVPLHPDSELFRFISEGIPGTAMPSFSDTLTDEEIWHVINYIKTFDDAS
jgi:mono/diheme cytochrome c family protein